MRRSFPWIFADIECDVVGRRSALAAAPATSLLDHNVRKTALSPGSWCFVYVFTPMSPTGDIVETTD